MSVHVWAIELDDVELCSRVQSIHDTDYNLKLFKRTSLANKLPFELMSQVEKDLFDSYFMEYRQNMRNLRACCQNRCKFWDVHLSDKETGRYRWLKREQQFLKDDIDEMWELQDELADLGRVAQANHDEVVQGVPKQYRGMAESFALRNGLDRIE